MATGHESSETSALTPGNAFMRGFLIRMLYGSLGILLVILIRPDFLGENGHLLFGAVAVYLLVCLAGGASDATVGRKTGMPSLPKRRAADVSSLMLLAVALVLLWQGR